MSCRFISVVTRADRQCRRGGAADCSSLTFSHGKHGGDVTYEGEAQVQACTCQRGLDACCLCNNNMSASTETRLEESVQTAGQWIPFNVLDLDGAWHWDPRCGLPRTVSADNQSVALGGCGSDPQLSSIPELESLRDRVATHAVRLGFRRDDTCTDVVAAEARTNIVLRSEGRSGGRLLFPTVILGSFEQSRPRRSSWSRTSQR